MGLQGSGRVDAGNDLRVQGAGVVGGGRKCDREGRGGGAPA